MKTKTIISLLQKLEALVVSINDEIPANAIEETLNYYNRTTEVFGFVIHESVFNWILTSEHNYDRKAIKENVTEYQWAMFTSIEKKYLNIILKNDERFRVDISIDVNELCAN